MGESLDTCWRLGAGLGRVLGSLGTGFSEAVAVLSANMAEKSDKSVNKSCFGDRDPTESGENWRPKVS